MSSLIVIDVLVLVGLLIIGVPVPLSFAGAVLVLVIFGDLGSAAFLVGAGYGKMSSVIIIALPLYILAGNLMSQGGIANRLIDLAESIFGRTRGGLGVVVVITTAVFGAISGMATSAVAAIGTIMIPRMVARGYDHAYATTLVAVSSVLALLIPPSASMILYGWVTGTSIAASFLAPVVPGLILIALFMFWNRVLCRKMAIKSVPAPEGMSTVQNIRAKGRRASWALLMPMVILGCIYGGVTTPTEAAAIAVVYAIPVSLLIYRDLNIKGLWQVFWYSAETTGVLMILVFFAAMFSRLLTMENVPQQILAAFLAVSDDPTILLLLVNLFLVVVGMLMEDVSGILLAAPMLLPVIKEVGMDPVQFAAIIATNLGMGLITPPTAPILYFAALIGKAPLSAMLRYVVIFVFLAYLPVVLLTTYVPELSLFLPRLLLN